MNKPLLVAIAIAIACPGEQSSAAQPQTANPGGLKIATSLSQASAPTPEAGPLARPPSPYPRTLDEAIRYAQDKHLSNRSAQLVTDQADALLTQAKSRFLPSIDLLTAVDVRENYDRYLGIDSSVTLPASVTGGTTPLTLDVGVDKTVPRYQITPAIRISYDLYNGGRDSANLKQSNYQLEASKIDVTVKLRDTAYWVTLAYLRLKQAVIGKDTAEYKEAVAEKRVRIAETQLDAKNLSQLALQAEQLRLAEARGGAHIKANELEARLLEYAAALGIDLAAVSAEALMPDFPSDPARDITIAAQWADDDLEAQRENAKLQAASEALRAEQAGQRPNVSLVGQYSAVGRDKDSLGQAASDMHQNETYLGVQVSFNLYDGSLRNSRIAEKRSQQDLASLRQEQTRRDIDESRRRRLTALHDAETRLEIARIHRDLCREELKIAQLRYDTKLGSEISLEEARAASQESENELKLSEIARAIADLNVRFSASNRSPLNRSDDDSTGS
jgi:outer membrane protein